LQQIEDTIVRKWGVFMGQPFIVNLERVPLRFTPDGKVSVVDAIRAVSDSGHSTTIWENLKAEHPEILVYCGDYSFEGEDPVQVVDSKGWERVWMLLPNYLSGLDAR
jgi:hypothetical protein